MQGSAPKEKDYFVLRFTEQCIVEVLTEASAWLKQIDPVVFFTKRRSSRIMAHHKSFSVDICEMDSDYQ